VESLLYADDCLAHAKNRILARTPADDQSFQFAVVFLKIAAHDEGSHAVPEEHDRHSRPAQLCDFRDLMRILDDGIAATAVKIAEFILGFDTLSVSAVIVDNAGKAEPGEVFDEVMIPFFHFRHPVNELEYALGRPAVRLGSIDFKLKPVDF